MMETKKKAAGEKPSMSVELPVPGPSTSAPKQAKLVLKPPKFITEAAAKKPIPVQSFSSLLEGVLELETAEEALEQLLKINEQSEPVLSRAGEKDVSSSLKIIGKLWKKLESSVAVCSVLVRTLVLVTRRVNEITGDTGLHGNVQSLCLSMADHG